MAEDRMTTWCCGRRGSLLLILATTLAMALSQDPIYWDDQAIGTRINYVTRKGIHMMLKWRNQFLNQLNATSAVWDETEAILNTTYSSTNMPNMTAYAIQKLQPATSKMANITALLASLNLTYTGDLFYGFMKSPQGTVNVGGAFNSTNRASGTFKVPMTALYRVTVRTTPASNTITDVMRNGNITLSAIANSNYFDVKTRIRLVWLNKNDEIFCTGFLPSYFGVWLVRKQELAPQFFP